LLQLSHKKLTCFGCLTIAFDLKVLFGLMEHNGAERNGTERNGTERSGMEQRFHSIVWVFHDGAE